MVRASDLVGQRFERLLVKARHPENTKGGKTQWVCACDCGNVVIATGSNLKNGHTRSCGCLLRETSKRVGLSNITHGMSYSPEYDVWDGMKRRCGDPASKDYERYGAKGITVSPRWLESFENFYADMGPRPSPLHTIDRIDNNGNYEPGNCRWATKEEQANNRSSNTLHNYQGQQKTTAELAKIAGMLPATLHQRLSNGMSLEEAMEKPVAPRRPWKWKEKP